MLRNIPSEILPNVSPRFFPRNLLRILSCFSEFSRIFPKICFSELLSKLPPEISREIFQIICLGITQHKKKHFRSYSQDSSTNFIKDFFRNLAEDFSKNFSRNFSKQHLKIPSESFQKWKDFSETYT